MKQSDIVIGGGGMAGLTLGIALARGGLSVVVADPLTKAAMTDAAFDGRVSALAYAAVRMYRALGIWTHLADQAQPIAQILVSDGRPGEKASPFSLHFDAQEAGTDALGHIAENRNIRAALFAAAAEEKTLTLLQGQSVVSLDPGPQSVTARLSGGEQIQARLAVAADGRDSALREAAGISLVRWAYAQTGIVTTVAHERPHNGVAYEHFLPAGPFAILPLTGNRSSLVWTEKRALAPALLNLPEADFNAEIARRFGDHLGATEAIGPRWSYPLRFHLARAYVAPRLALLGDAAHGIHPIAGQGLNLGLKDVAALAETLLDAARLGRDIGALDVLKRYERWRRFDSFTLAAGTDALNRLFSNDAAPLRALRDLGMGIVDSIGPARRFFMRHAGGDVGKLPRLMKGEAA